MFKHNTKSKLSFLIQYFSCLFLRCYPPQGLQEALLLQPQLCKLLEGASLSRVALCGMVAKDIKLHFSTFNRLLRIQQHFPLLSSASFLDTSGGQAKKVNGLQQWMNPAGSFHNGAADWSPVWEALPHFPHIFWPILSASSQRGFACYIVG